MLLEYKGFIATVNFISRTACFYGEVINNKDGFIIFQAELNKDLKEAFNIAVDQYLEYIGMCTPIG